MTKKKTAAAAKGEEREPSQHDVAMREAGYVRATRAASAAGISKSAITIAVREGLKHKNIGRALYVHWSALIAHVTGGDATTQKALGLNPNKLPQ